MKNNNKKELFACNADSSSIGLETPDAISLSNLEEYSNYYATLGWYQIPVVGKIPNLKGWPDNGRLIWDKSWRAENLGIITGGISDIIVLDVDPKSGGDHSIAALQDEYGQLDTVMVQTGGGGLHYYFKYPKGIEAKNSVGKIAVGLDIRSDRGYAVAPPSIHPHTGEPYQWIDGYAPWERGLAEVPKWLLEKIVPASNKEKSVPTPSGSIPEGSRNDTLFRLACTLLREGLGVKAVVAAVKAENQHKCYPPLEDAEVEGILRSACERCEQPTLVELVGGYPVVNNHGKPNTRHWQNTQYICDWLGIQFRYNLMSKELETKGGELEAVSFNSLVTRLIGLCTQQRYEVSQNNLINHIETIAEANKYSPVQEYLIQCQEEWDGTSRIEELFNCFVLDEKGEEIRATLVSLFRKWLISCVVMAFNEGGKSAQGVLILKGAQGIGKTRWLKYLLPSEGKSWGMEGLTLDPHNKDDVMRATKYWISELGEIRSSITARRVDDLKSFITGSMDVLRSPYGRVFEKRPRTTVFYGTVNDEQFLQDKTGERRFWVIPISEINLNPNLAIDQIWGEITQLALEKGESYWLTTEEIRKVNEMNQDHKFLSAEEQAITDRYDWNADPFKWFERTALEVCHEIEFMPEKASRVGRTLSAMTECGKVKKRRASEGSFYTLPPIRTIDSEDVA